MTFLARWIRRELANDLWWCLFFVLSLGLGLFSFITLDSFRDALEKDLKANARELLSADFAVSSRRSLSDPELTRFRQVLGPRQESHVVEFFSMAAARQSSRLVQVKAIDDQYPLYGSFRLGSGRFIRNGDAGVLESEPGVWVYPELLSQLNLQVGDRVRIGSLDFKILDTIQEDSTQTFRLASLAPKVYFSLQFLPQTDLVKFGTTFSDVYLYRLEADDDGLTKLRRDLETEFPDPNIQFATPSTAAQDSGRALQTLLDYLGLVSLVGLALGLVGIGYLIQLFLSRRIATLSLLRTLGLSVFQAEIFLLFELCFLGLIANLVILPLSVGLLPVLGALLSDLVALPFTPRLSLKTSLVGLTLSTLLPLLIAWPLMLPLRRLNLKQVLLDRELWQIRFTKNSLWSWLPALFLYGGLAVWISHSYKTASIFMTALLGAALVIVAFSFFAMRFLPFAKGDWRWRQARHRLRRAPLRFSIVVLALSFGTLLLVLLPQIRSSLNAELAGPEATRLPSLFLFDVQDEQVQGVTEFLREQNLSAQYLSPLIRSRLLTVNETAFERALESSGFSSREEEAEARFRNRGINLTYRADLSSTETLEEGEPFSGQTGEVAEISVEQKYAERMGFRLGDFLKFDVQGVEIQGRIKNFRSVKWNSFQPNFFISFQPGFLDEAPKTWLLSVPPVPEERKNGLQSELVMRFPNVSIVDVSRVIERVLKLTDQMLLALTAMAALSVLVGVFVLFTVLLTESANRLVEWNLYKVLGSSSLDVLTLYLFESLVISSVSALLGGVLGLALGWGLLKWMFAAPFLLDPLVFVLALLIPFSISLILSWRLGRRLMRTESSSLLAEGRL